MSRSKENEIEFHGWTSVNGSHPKRVSIHVGFLPGRKSPCLYIADGTLKVLAYFKNEEAAKEAVRTLDWIMGIKQ